MKHSGTPESHSSQRDYGETESRVALVAIVAMLVYTRAAVRLGYHRGERVRHFALRGIM